MTGVARKSLIRQKKFEIKVVENSMLYKSAITYKR